jgi:hypothetical protein
VSRAELVKRREIVEFCYVSAFVCSFSLSPFIEIIQ